MVISRWTEVEFASMLARHIRMGDLALDSALEARLRFDTMISESFVVLSPDQDDFERATYLLASSKLD